MTLSCGTPPACSAAAESQGAEATGLKRHQEHGSRVRSCSLLFLCFHCVLKAIRCSKPRGIRAARKLKIHHKNQRWAQKSYKKANLGTALKANPFEGASHAKGIVVEKMYVCFAFMFSFCGELTSRVSAVLRPSSPTLPFVSASVFSSSRTARRLPLSSPMTVA